MFHCGDIFTVVYTISSLHWGLGLRVVGSERLQDNVQCSACEFTEEAL